MWYLYWNDGGGWKVERYTMAAEDYHRAAGHEIKVLPQ